MTTEYFARAFEPFATALVAALLCCVPVFASAEESDKSRVENWWQQPWEIDARIYGWLPNAPAAISVNGEEVAVLPESLDTILDSANMLFMGEFEVHKGRVGLFADVIYYDGTDSKNFTGPLGAERKVTLKERVWLVEYGLGFELATWNLGKRDDPPTLTLSPFAGFRFFHDPIKVSVPAGAVFPGINAKRTVDINTPIIGTKASLKLSDRWAVEVGADHGVWDADEVDKTWQYIGVVKYHFEIKSQSSEVFAGYRKLRLELEKDSREDIDIDVALKGPVIGFGLSW